MTDIDRNAFNVAWACHANTERFARAMRDLATSAPTMSAEDRALLVTGLLAMADRSNVEASDVDIHAHDGTDTVTAAITFMEY